MKFRHFALFALLAAPLCLHAQKRKVQRAPVLTVEELAEQAINRYDFNKAEEILNKEITTLKRRKKDVTKMEAMLQVARVGAAKLHATERIIIVDSLVCPEEEALKLLKLSRESGRIDTYASTYHTRKDSASILYENELGNKRYLAIEKDSALVNPHAKMPQFQLAVTDKIGNTWSEPIPLSGLNEDITQNFPFLLSDGVTLYYAAKGDESMGGYDIFVSRSDGEDGSFLAPENVGFPFNSTANDYMFAIDELNQLGWFISDRRQPEGQVCIYTFIPNETREVYGDEVSDSELQNLARISLISDTWKNEDSTSAEDTVEEAKKRLEALRNGTHLRARTPDFIFPIDNNRTYHQLSEFRSKKARELMEKWVELNKNVSTDNEMLQRLRDNYATTGNEQRAQLASSIQRIESTLYPQMEQLKKLAKEIRNAEISNK